MKIGKSVLCAFFFLLCFSSEAQRAFTFDKNQGVCENSSFDLRTLNIVPPSDMHIYGWYDENDVLLYDQSSVYVYNTPVTIVLKTRKGDGQNCFDTLIITPVPYPFFEVGFNDTTVCSGEYILASVKSKIGVESLTWTNLSTHEKFKEGDLIKITQASQFLLAGGNSYCRSNYTLYQYVNVQPKVDTNSMYVHTNSTIDICPGCVVNLNEMLSFEGDSIKIHAITWEANGLPVADPNISPAVSTTYKGTLSATIYKSNNCGMATKSVHNLTIWVYARISDCKLTAGWSTYGNYPCEDHLFYIMNPQVQGFVFDAADISVTSANGYSLSYKESSVISGKKYFYYNYFPKDTDTVYIHVSYENTCSGVSNEDYFDTLYFKVQEEGVVHATANFCKGDTLEVVFHEYLESLHIDSVDLGVWENYFRFFAEYQDENGVWSQFVFRSLDTIHDTHFFDTITAVVYVDWCDQKKEIHLKITPQMPWNCYPYTETRIECPGDTTYLNIVESRLPNAYVKSIDLSFPSSIAFCYLDSNRWGGYKQYIYKIIPYATGVIDYKILYNEGGKDTLIESFVDIYTSFGCEPRLIVNDEKCPGEANSATIEMNNKTGRIVSTHWYASDTIVVDSIDASIPPDMSSLYATYNYEVHVKRMQFLYCAILYTVGDSLKLDTIRQLVYTDNTCIPELTKNSNTYCDSEKALLYITNRSPEDSIISIVWDSVAGCSVFLDSISGDGNIWYFSREVQFDTVFRARVKVLDYFGDTVEYYLNTSISVKPFPRVFKNRERHVCENEIINLYDEVNGLPMISSILYFKPTNVADVSVPIGQESAYFGAYALAGYTCASMTSPYIQDSIKLVRNSAPQITADKISDICVNDSFQLKASFALYDYVTWMRDSDTIYSNKRITDVLYELVLKSATYTAISRNACGTATDAFFLTAKPAPLMETGNDTTVCLYDTAFVYLKPHSQIDFQTLSWYIDTQHISDQSFRIGIDDLNPIQVVAVAYGLNQCWGRDTMRINPQNLPDIAISAAGSDTDSTFCNKQSAAFTLTASGTATSWKWLAPEAFEGNTSANITVSPTDTTTVFSVEGADVFGCKNQTKFYLTVIPDQTLPNTTEGEICERSRFVLEADTLPDMTYIWTKPNSGKIYSFVLRIDSMTAADTGLYQLERTQYGCTAVDYFRLSMKETPYPFILADNSPLCENTSLNLEGQFITNTTQKWIKPDLTEVSGNILNIADIRQSDAGTYIFKIKKDDCEDSLSVDVRVDARSIPSFSLDKSFYCDEDSALLTLLPADADSFAVQTPGRVFKTLQPSIRVENLYRSDSGRLILYANRLTCQDTAYINLDVRYRPNPLLIYDSQYCNGDSIRVDFTVENDVAYQWTGPDGYTSTEPVLRFLQVNENLNGYYVLVASKNQCESYPDTANLLVYPLPVVKLDTITYFCSGDDLLIDMFRPGGSYIWSTGETTSSIVVKNPGRYGITITENGCVNQDVTDISERPKPEFYLGNDTTLCYGTVFTLHINYPNADSCLWLNDSSVLSSLVSDSAAVYVAKAFLNGCEWIDSVRIMNKFCGEILMPNAFRPDSDIEVNRLFKPASKSSPDLIVYEIFIYDKWGKLIFNTKNMDEGWDGTHKGKPVAPGVYVYKIVAHETIFGTDLSKTGTVVLIR